MVEVTAPMVPTPCRVAERTVETPATVTLALESVDGRPMGFRPGQFEMLYSFGVGEVPISVSGGRDGRLLLTISAVGAVTRALCASPDGHILGIRGPYGTGWEVEDAAGKDVVVVAGGIGLAPLRPVVEQVLAERARYRSLCVLIGARTPDLLLFTEDVRAWGRAEDTHVGLIVDAATSGWGGEVGFVTELIPRAPFDPANATAFMCGPEIMMRNVAPALMDRGIPAHEIRISMERNMKCAIGHCGHCQFGPEFICKDGPVYAYDRVSRLIGTREV